MPAYNRKFSSPTFHEETVVERNDAVVGRIRIKPSSVLWKPKGSRVYYSVNLDKFIAWITASSTGADLTKS